MTDYNQDYDYDVHKTSGFIAGLVIGGVLGGVLGAGAMLLLAPKSGKRMRAALREKSIHLRDQTSDAMEDMIAQAGTKARQTEASVRKQAKELERSRKNVMDEQKKRLSTLVEAGKSAVQGADFSLGMRK